MKSEETFIVCFPKFSTGFEGIESKIGPEDDFLITVLYNRVLSETLEDQPISNGNLTGSQT